jgi:hypothetical protein
MKNRSLEEADSAGWKGKFAWPNEPEAPCRFPPQRCVPNLAEARSENKKYPWPAGSDGTRWAGQEYLQIYCITLHKSERCSSIAIGFRLTINVDCKPAYGLPGQLASQLAGHRHIFDMQPAFHLLLQEQADLG